MNLSTVNNFCFDQTPCWPLISYMPGKTNASRNSAAVEDYLERILELINSKGYARVVDIAAAL